MTIRFTPEQYKQLEDQAGPHPLSPYCRDLVVASLAPQVSLGERLCLQEIVATRAEERALARAILAGLRELCTKAPATDQDVSNTMVKVDSAKEALAAKLLHQAVKG